MKVTPGKKIAKAIGARFIQAGEKKTLGLEVMFQFTESGPEGEYPAKLSWVGWCSEAALSHTMKTLVDVLEFNGNDKVVQVPDGDPRQGMLEDEKAINYDKEVELVVEMEEHDGKWRPRIKWVNNVGGGQFAGASVDTVKSTLGALGFKAAFLAAKKGARTAPPAPTSSPQGPVFTDEDVPF